MFWVRTLVVVCAITSVTAGSGCFLFPSPRVVAERATELTNSTPPEVSANTGRVLLHTRLIEQPLGDEYLSHEVWTQAANPLSHDTAALLTVNGFRVGVISGVIPADLERLATSEPAVVNASLRAILSDQPKPIPVNASAEPISLRSIRNVGDEPQVLELSNSECAVVVTASPTIDGRVKVRCEPRVQHGAKQPHWGPTADGTGFERYDQRPTEQFPMLAWEVILAKHEVLLIGCVEEESSCTLGQSFFQIRDPSRLKQRVLAIQADFNAGQVGVTSGVPGALVR